MTPTQRSLKYLREQGFTVAITERWNSYARIRQDLFGFIDLVAIRRGDDNVLAIQTTVGSVVSERIKKIASLDAALVWLDTGSRIVVHGWRKAGERGKRKTWQVREIEVTAELLEENR